VSTTPCSKCGGSGTTGTTTCSHCNGAGYTPSIGTWRGAIFRDTCFVCGGKGVVKIRCASCNGLGHIVKDSNPTTSP
jgi:DnaJ-class molecular chaperone